jgi:hypothetical protein
MPNVVYVSPPSISPCNGLIGHRGHAAFSQERCAVFEVGQVRCARGFEIGTGWEHAGNKVNGPGAQLAGVFGRLPYAGAELRLTPWKRSEPALAGAPVALRRIDQGKLQVVPFERARKKRSRPVIRDLELDALKPRRSGGGKAIEKRDFVEEIMKIGGEARHGCSRILHVSFYYKRISSSPRCSYEYRNILRHSHSIVPGGFDVTS